MCGEQYLKSLRHPFGTGSPPRVRGTGSGENKIHKGAGITPACAGNSLAMSMKDVCIQDHPRVCGEQPTIK